LVDAHDSNSCGFGRVGSTPTSGTLLKPHGVNHQHFAAFVFNIGVTMV